MIETMQEFYGWEKSSRDTIDFKKIYCDIAGDVRAGLVLSELVYWYLPSKNGGSKLRVERDGHYWIAVRRYEWWDRTRMSPRQADTDIKKLVKVGVIETRTFKFSGKPTVHIRIIEDKFLALFNQMVKTPKTNPFLPNGELELTKPLIPYTETTAKSTTTLAALHDAANGGESTTSIAQKVEWLPMHEHAPLIESCPTCNDVIVDEHCSCELSDNIKQLGNDPFVDHNLPGAIVTPLIPADKLPPTPLPSPIKLDPATLTKTDWSKLGRALYFVRGTQKHHIHAESSEIARMGVFLDAGVIKALGTEGKYKLTDDGYKWVRTWIDIHGEDFREAGIKWQERWEDRKRRESAKKEQKRQTPPTPTGKRKVPQIAELIFNRMVSLWGKPATKTEHNTFVSTALEFYHAQGTLDEIDAIWKLKQDNDWKIGTVRLCVTKLGQMRKEQSEIAALPTITDREEQAAYEPPDPLANVAYFADEEK